MASSWIKALIKVDGADVEEVAGALAYDHNLTVEVADGAEITLWLDSATFSPEAVHEIVSSLRVQFPEAFFHQPVIEIEPDEDWLKKWKESFTPLPIGESLVIVPSWWRGPIPENRKIITLDPGMAFGTGHHPATAICMESLERFSTGLVLDVGCGSGILAITAALSGAERVIGVDNDPEATIVAKENVEINSLETKVEIRDGTIDCVDEPYVDIIVANLFLNALTVLAPAFYAKLKSSGTLIASGLRLEQGEPAQDAFERAGFTNVERIDKDEWTALVMRRPG
ncbi:MAG: 50S ribosomal protein L11 methyltransferase [Nitrospinae bacterium]|nr:50S ribosomal protein L11 methyltransferase [Nitrospinota bacterium]